MKPILFACVVGLFACNQTEPPDPLLPKIAKLANPGPPPGDTSNKYVGNALAEELGKKLYFDSNLSGHSTAEDMLRRAMTTPPRAAQGQPIGVACNTCHEVARGASDHTADPPGNRVSFGAGAYDVNGQQSINSSYLDLVYWNGRNDSLWAQIVAVTESPVSVGSSRLRVAWRIADAYRADYTAAFPEYPLPAELDSVAAQQDRLAADGQCKLDGVGGCPATYCRTTMNSTGVSLCLPRFPLAGRPGFAPVGVRSPCDFPQPNENTLQPNNDAYDCMDFADQLIVTRIYVNYAKAVASYEYQLRSSGSPFDKWVTSGFTSNDLSASAKRGARLFVGKGICDQCHTGALMTDNLFHNIGVPQTGTYVPTLADCPQGGWCDCVSDDHDQPKLCLPNGFRDGLRKLQANGFRRDSKWSDDATCQSHASLHNDANYAKDNPTECDGRVKYYSTPFSADQVGTWKTPSLRDVALTGPYMHNGMYATLREVIDHYNQGGIVAGMEPVGTRDKRILKLNLTSQEEDDLVAFLQSLTGTVDAAVVAPPVVPAASPF